VKRGEVGGIIGRNGAGKSTPLKRLSCIIPPSKGASPSEVVLEETIFMLKTARKSLAAILGLTIIRSKALSVLTCKSNPFAEQKRLAGLGSLTIFDVGAYIGEVSRAYVELFHAARVYSLEPFF
jgi:ABC-type sugar transport system ATPase subunit